MSKSADIAKVSAKGTFDYIWGLIVSTVISSIGTIFIARLLAPDQYGLYTIVLTVPNLLVIFGNLGMNSAIVRFTAQYRTEDRKDEIRSIYAAGIAFEIFLGLILTAFAFLSSDYLAVSLFSRPVIAPFIKIIAFAVLANGIAAAGTAAFTGYEKMEFNSVMLIAQSIFKTALIITLVLVGLGTAGATIGFTSGAMIAGAIGLALIGTIYRGLPKPFTHKLEIKAYLATMLTYCLPLTIATLIVGLLPQYYAFLLPIHYSTDNAIIGNYGIAMNFVVLITFFATPITAMMFPAFSKLDAEKDREPLKNIFKFSIKYASFLVVPVTALVMCLAEPAVSTLFGSRYDTAPLFLALLAIQYLYTALGNLSLNGLLNGQDKTGYVLKLSLLTGAIGFPMGYIGIMNFGVIGLIATTLVSAVPSIFVGLRFIRKTYGVSVDWSSSARILVSSAIAAGVTYAAVSALSFSSWIKLIVGVIIFMVVLVPSALFTKSIDKYDVASLREMASGLGVVGRLVKVILEFIEKLIVTFKL